MRQLLLTGLVLAGIVSCSLAPADTLPPAPQSSLPVLTIDAAVRWALENNPELAAIRQQRGVAAAGIVIAQTYPHNPIWEGKIRAAVGPESAGITNAVSNEHKFLMDVEVRGQRRIRQEAAGAALSRTEAEIANQEITLAVRVVRAFDTAIYRFRKRELISTIIDLNKKAAEQVEDLVHRGRLNAADLIVIRAEVEDARSQLGPGQTAFVTARYELSRALGIPDDSYLLSGAFSVPPSVENDAEQLLHMAFEHRADLRARQIAVGEADARLRLEIANRFGNPNLGPAYEYDPTRINLIGVQIALPLPVFNTHRGEIMQRDAERVRAALELRQAEVTVQQDVHSALARLDQARRTAETYQREVLPNLEKAFKDIRTLFEARAPGVDLLRVIDVQRKLLKARDTELDAIYEVRLALADLALAAGDPAVAVFPCGKP
jgi:cobalt-zinc-cadmium efflux system outer membrane protein